MAKQICVEELSGVCLKYRTVPDAPATTQGPSRAEREERALGLNREDRRAVQRGLRAAGHYRGGIDGAIGPGSRRAIRAWQRATGRPATGFLDAGAVAALSTPASAAGSTSDVAGAYIAICSAGKKSRAYTVHVSERSVQDALRKARRANANCDWPIVMSGGQCFVDVASDNGPWTQRKRRDRGAAEQAALSGCRSRDGENCRVERAICSTPGARLRGSDTAEYHTYLYGAGCVMAGSLGQFGFDFSDASFADASNKVSAAWPYCRSSMTFGRGSCIAVARNGEESWYWVRRQGEAKAREEVLKDCRKGGASCEVNAVVCLR